MMQSGFVIVDENAGGNVHGIAKDKPFFDAAFFEALLDLRRDVNKLTSAFCVEPEFFSIAFHDSFSPVVFR
jgi:hypothetical protein